MFHYDTIEEYMQSEHGQSKYSYGSGWLPKTHARSDKQTMKVRRSTPINAWTGANGAGKSLGAVLTLLPTLDGIKWKCSNRSHYHFKKYGITEGYRVVVSTCPLFDPRTGKPHPLWVPYRNHRQLLELCHADIFLDEILGAMGANDPLPIQIQNKLQQLRRSDCRLDFTAPNWTQANIRIRQVTKTVNWCESKIPVPAAGRDWPPRLLMVIKTFDTAAFEAFQVDKKNKVFPETFELYWRPGKRNLAQDFYDTLGEVLTVESISDTGMCMHCGGNRAKPVCKCDRDAVDSAEAYFDMTQELDRRYGSTIIQGWDEVAGRVITPCGPPVDADVAELVALPAPACDCDH